MQQPELVGSQQPRVLHLPDFDTTASGQETVELARAAGLVLDPWQAFGVEHICSEVRDPRTGRMRWAAYEAALFVARQNGKGGIIEARELGALALFGERVLHSAHHFKTTRDAFERMQQIIESCPDLDRMVKQVTTGAGNEGIVFKGGGRVQYASRKRGSGRGLPPDVVVNDEAFDYPEASHTALMPAVSARPNPQFLYFSSPPDEFEHPNSLVISRLRLRALRGGDPRLFFAEWSAAESAELEEMLSKATPEQRRAWLGDVERWLASNPALGYRITGETIERELVSMSPRGFAVERLGIGYWPDPEQEDDDDERPFDPQRWELAGDRGSLALDPVALAVDVAPDGTTALTAVGWRADGRKHAEVVQVAPGTGWVPPAVLGIVNAWDPAVMVVDGASPAAALVPKLEAAGLEPMVTNGTQFAAACEGLANDVAEDVVRHVPCKPLDDAVDSVRWRQMGDRRAYDRRRDGAPIAPIVALALANYGLDTTPPPTRAAAPAPEPLDAAPAPAALTGAVDLTRVSF